MSASFGGEIEVAAFLLNKGADFDIADNVRYSLYVV